MTNQNNAAQAAEQAIKAAIRKAYDDGYNDAKMAPDNCSTYSVERAVRLDSAALLSKLRAPVSDIREGFELTYAADADDPACASDLTHFTNGWRACIMSQVRAPVASAEVMDALNWVDDFIARCNRDDRGSCESVNVLRRALASAPVAEQAALSAQSATKDDKAAMGLPECGKPLCAPGEHHPLCRHGWAEKKAASAPVAGEAQNSDSRYAAKSSTYDAAPQASEAVRDALIAFDEAMRLCDDFPELQHHRDALLFAVQKARAALSAQPADKPAISSPSSAGNPCPAPVPAYPQTGKSHTDGGAVYG